MIAFPESWKMVKINTVCEHIVDCINKTAPVVDYETPYKMIRTTNVKEGRVNLDVTRYVTEQTFIKWNRRLTPRKHDVVLTREAPLGDVGLIRSSENVMLGQRTMLYRANPEVLDQHFLYYSLLGGILQAQIRMLGSGSTVEHMRVPDAEQLEVPLPPLLEQKKIAAILTSYDGLIETNNQRIHLLEKMAEEVYKEWFVRLRFPGHEAVKVVKGVPEGWKVETISTIGKVVTGKTPSMAKSNYYGGDIHFIKTPDMHGQKFILDTSEHLTEDGLNSQPSQIIPANSICVSCIGTGGVVSISTEKCSTNQQINTIILNDIQDLEWAFYTLKSMKGMIEAFGSTGTTMVNLSKGKFSKLKVRIPNEELRKQFNAAIQPLFLESLLLNKTNKKLVETRDTLLPRLISGKLSVENLDINFPPSMEDALA